MRFRIFRYDPDRDAVPRLEEHELAEARPEMMLLEALLLLKERDESLSFRHSCHEGVCGSDAMNINGRNGLACITPLKDLAEPVTLRPLPGLPVIRDLVVDLEPFFRQYRAVRPWLVAHEPLPETERRQRPEERARLDGLYECILCACCSTACPSWWWNPERFRGPAALLQAARFLEDSRDQATAERLQELDGPYRLFRCHSIQACVQVCPKGLDPSRAIGRIRERMLQHLA
ncbi:MAG: succinate dehydrogenase iron-sulfur subunit [Gammaproteobacteria bacterium]|nr:MAG: succinate dehydrogenase iron-sulfur subunit [Gammaproteobacteria bacterium]